MILPTLESLNAMSQLVGGKDFTEIGPESRIKIIDLVLKADIGDLLHDLPTDIAVAFSDCQPINTIAAKLKTIGDELNDMDGNLSAIASWFEKSKLWEGRIDK